MALRFYANAPATTLSASCTNSATSIQVTSVVGLPIQYPYTLILDRGTGTEEAVSVTAAAGTTLTVTRAIDGTTAFAHSIGATVEHGITAQDIREANAHVNANSSVHGVSGSVVGTSDVQTVTNKDLSSATNTFPSALATDAEVTSAVSTHAGLTTGVHGVGAGSVVGTALTQTLTNKTISADNNTLSGIAPSSFVLSDASGNLDGAAAQKAIPAGVVVGTTDVQTMTNKTLSTGTKVGAATTDISGAWTTWSPTLTGIALGNGTLTAAYVQIGKTVHFRFELLFGSTTTISAGSNTFTLPVPARQFRWKFIGEATDSGVASFVINTRIIPASPVTAVEFTDTNKGSGADQLVTTTEPFTWGTGDILSVFGTYEAN